MFFTSSYDLSCVEGKHHLVSERPFSVIKQNSSHNMQMKKSDTRPVSLVTNDLKLHSCQIMWHYIGLPVCINQKSGGFTKIAVFIDRSPSEFILGGKTPILPEGALIVIPTIKRSIDCMPLQPLQYNRYQLHEQWNPQVLSFQAFYMIRQR